MKRILILLVFLTYLSISALGQSNPPLTVTEPDGSPRVTGVTTLKFSNGSVSCSGKVCTVTTGGGGGSPGGSNTQLQYNAAGNFGGITGATSNGTVVTLTNALATTAFSPSSNDGATLGSGTVSWSDLFLASGALINFANGNVVLTHSSGILTVSTGDLRVTSAGTNTASAVTVGGTQTLSNKTLASPSLTGNLSGATTSEVRFGTNIVAYEDGVGPKFTDSNTGAILTFDVQNLTVSRVVTWPNVAGNAALTDGTLTNGNCAEFDASGRIVDSGGTCGGGSGGITVGTTTVTSGTNTRVLFNNSGVVGEYVITGTGNVAMSASPTFTGTLAAAAITASSTITQTSNSATAFESGPNGGTNPVFRLVNNTASAATGLSITGLAAGNAVRLNAISSGTNEGILISGKGLGAVSIGASYSQSGLFNIAGSGGERIAFFAQTGQGWMGTVGPHNVTLFTSNSNGSLTLSDTTKSTQLRSGSQYAWVASTTDSNSGSADTGFARPAAAVVRVTNGSTGAGSLVLGTSTVGGIGTSGVGVLAIANGTAPSSSPADEFQMYAADYAAGDSRANILSENNATPVTIGNHSVLTGYQHLTKTADYTVVTADSNAFFDNAGAGAGVVFTLPTPTASPSLKYTFCRVANQTVTVDIGGSVTIRGGASVTTSGGNVTLDAVGTCLTIYSVSSTEWYASATLGTLTFN